MSAAAYGLKRTATSLRCRMCGRELISQPSDIVPHKPGPGQVAFEPRKRDPRWAVVPSKMPASAGAAVATATEGTESGAREAPTPAQGSSAGSSADQQPERLAADSGAGVTTDETQGSSAEAAPAATPAPAPAPAIQTAASLSARLPPHLAALRLGRPAAAAAAFASASATPAAAACSSHFVEPQPWMAKFLDGGEVRGRIECPNARCSGKLGSWDWAGAQCGCGAWITPAFALHASRVDAK
ncbi:tyrosine protein phosphatase yvh1 [Tilletia horrida]|uniref:protein-tyrosine-phosphatase n=1 Tax=Tilletia horrida TaxID=155126 RepID=A0AAN6GKD7_9BASI|nr:tyrosine protein phosphatase yvh1 [Tilletia horrida]KAK0538234.1 tyrosine protein phosphatase yvh1 [Tilletia horrida]KAK0541140.1 tyrosine protein phosphatase yvh1 [Tilletia horrida]